MDLRRMTAGYGARGWLWCMIRTWSGMRGMAVGNFDHDNQHTGRDGNPGGAESPGVGAMGNGAVFGQTRGAVEAVSNRDSV